jgi:hypothetical protein
MTIPFSELDKYWAFSGLSASTFTVKLGYTAKGQMNYWKNRDSVPARTMAMARALWTLPVGYTASPNRQKVDPRIGKSQLGIEKMKVGEALILTCNVKRRDAIRDTLRYYRKAWKGWDFKTHYDSKTTVLTIERIS